MYRQIAIRGWPDKSHEEDTRLIFDPDEMEAASNVMDQLGGLFRCEMRMVDEMPNRSIAEVITATQIKNSIVPTIQ